MNASFAFPQPLSDKYRPHRVRDFIGIPKICTVMERFIEAPYPSVWFFLGASGLGKTSMALAVAEQLGAELHHIPSRNCDEAAIDHVCHICHYIPLNKAFHVVLADEADKMSPNAQLALLSKLDATAMPPQTVFFFTANSVVGLEDRFLSRCRILIFEPESMCEVLPRFLKRISKMELGGGQPQDIDYDRLSADSNFNVRDALMELEVALMSVPRKIQRRKR